MFSPCLDPFHTRASGSERERCPNCRKTDAEHHLAQRQPAIDDGDRKEDSPPPPSRSISDLISTEALQYQQFPPLFNFRMSSSI